MGMGWFWHWRVIEKIQFLIEILLQTQITTISGIKIEKKIRKSKNSKKPKNPLVPPSASKNIYFAKNIINSAHNNTYFSSTKILKISIKFIQENDSKLLFMRISE